jgi:hypothetical protein
MCAGDEPLEFPVEDHGKALIGVFSPGSPEVVVIQGGDDDGRWLAMADTGRFCQALISSGGVS